MLVQRIVEYLLARGEHQRADDAPRLIAYARQSAQPRAAQHVYEKGLYRVVDMVRDGRHGVAVLAAQLGEPCVTQTPRRHLHRFARALHLAHGVETAVVAHYAVFAGGLLHQYLVLVALRAPQAEVAVGHGHMVAAVDAQRHEHHRIDSARHGEQDLVLLGKESVATDVFLKVIDKHVTNHNTQPFLSRTCFVASLQYIHLGLYRHAERVAHP